MAEFTSVSVSHLSKFYGSTRGVEDISFEVGKGEVFGLLGPNGAGKTTVIRTLVGLISATAGSAEILGLDALKESTELRRKIGYLPGIAATYHNYRARNFLRFMARMRGLELDSEIENLAERLDLDLDFHIHDLSKGNRQKVSVIQASMHKPEVLFLDEPTSGLDPIVQREFEKLLEETKQRGGTVVLSSHVLSEVEHLADRVAVFKEGRIVVVERIAILKAKARRKISLFFTTPIRESDFVGIANIHELEISDNQITCVITGSEHDLLARAVELGVTEVRSHESSLEEIFLDLVGAA